VLTTQDRGSYLRYLAKYGKSYQNLEQFEVRLQLWKKTDEFIKNYRSDGSFEMGHNKFSDWTEEEKKQILGRKQRK